MIICDFKMGLNLEEYLQGLQLAYENESSSHSTEQVPPIEILYSDGLHNSLEIEILR